MRDEQQSEQQSEWRSWAANQLTNAGWTPEQTPKVHYIINQFLGMGVVATHRGTPEFNRALAVVSELFAGKSLAEANWSDSKREEAKDSRAVWVRVQPGQALNLQDKVRVMAAAYKDAESYMHNGVEGTVIGVRYGKAVVHYDGAPPGTGHHHDIRLLEVKVVPIQ